MRKCLKCRANSFYIPCSILSEVYSPHGLTLAGSIPNWAQVPPFSLTEVLYSRNSTVGVGSGVRVFNVRSIAVVNVMMKPNVVSMIACVILCPLLVCRSFLSVEFPALQLVSYSTTFKVCTQFFVMAVSVFF